MITTRRRWLAGVLVLAVAAGVAVAVAVNRSSTTSGHGSDGTSAMIPATGGVSLAAQLFAPAGSGPHPLLVMPVPFGSPGSAYDSIAAPLARQGYDVVTYLQRGFRESQGSVDFAGPDTQHDVSTVITWALAHTDGDAAQIGMFGLSYGAGMSLLAAARDPRIKAVAALSTWTDFDTSFDPNDTPSTVALTGLINQTRGRIAASVRPLATTRDTAAFGPTLATLAKPRSPQSYLAQLNENKPAILIANAYQDAYFAPSQLVTFFAGYDGPKRLQLAPGDHGSLEYAALRGGADKHQVVPDAVKWLDHYLRGADNGVASWQPYALADVTTGQTRQFASWPASGTPVALGRPNMPGDVGTAAAWSADLTAGRDSGADFGPFQFGATYKVPTTSVGSWAAGTYQAWSTAAFDQPVAIAGTPQVHLRLASSTSAATVFAYLYEVTPSGLAALISAEPYTAAGLTPGAARSVTFVMQPIAWTTRPGDHLVLTLDTADPRYTSLTPAGTTVTVSSTAADPATVLVPAT